MVISAYEEWEEVMPKFVVISGKKQSGKTTAAKYIAKFLDISKVVSFADPIKEFCRDILGLTEEQIYGTEEEKNSLTDIMWDKMPSEIRLRYDPATTPPKCDTCGHQEVYWTTGIHFGKTGRMTAREVMQIFGTDVCRQSFGQNVWTDALFRKYGSTLYKFIVVDDCRFPNELDAAIKHNAICIHLTRNVLGPDQHVSETALDGWVTEDKYDHIIDNQELTIEETEKILRKIVDGPAF